MNVREEPPDLAKLTAICQYLKDLHKKRIVAPSISLSSRPYPADTANEEELQLHCVNLHAQSEVIKDIEEQITSIKESCSIDLCAKTFDDYCHKLKKKRLYLENKFLSHSSDDAYQIISIVLILIRLLCLFHDQNSYLI